MVGSVAIERSAALHAAHAAWRARPKASGLCRHARRRVCSLAAVEAQEVKVTLSAPFGLALRTLPASKSGRGVYVEEVVEGGSAFQAGSVLPGDVLVSCGHDDKEIDALQLRFDEVVEVLQASAGEPLPMTFKRYKGVAEDTTTTLEGRLFLARNAEVDGTVVLASGMQYRVIESSKEDAAPSPNLNTPCDCNYEGRLIDGTVFDSSYKRQKAGTFAPDQVISGWTEAMQLMKEGDKWELFIPSELAYGASGSGRSVGPGQALIFKLEMLAVPTRMMKQRF